MPPSLPPPIVLVAAAKPPAHPKPARRAVDTAVETTAAFFEALEKKDSARALALAKGPLDPNAKNDAGVAALYAVVLEGNLSLARVLLERGARPDGELGPMDIPQVPLLEAARQEDPALLALLLEKGADPKKPGGFSRETALHVAAEAGRMAHLELLLKRLPPEAVNAKDEEGLTPLHAALHGDGDVGPMFRRLLELGADPSVVAKTCPMVWFALRGKHDPEAQWLLDHMSPEARKAFLVQTFDEQRSALGWAAFTGRTEAVTLLLKAGADPNARDRFDATPLNLVVRKDYVETVTALLAGKADPEIPDKEGFKPLYWATAHGFTDVVRLLLDAKADRLHTNPQDMPLLHTAARLGRPETLSLLLERGEVLEGRDPFGATPFLRAIEQAKLDCAKRLLAKGADAKATMPDGANGLMLLAGCTGHRIDLDAEPSEPLEALALLVSKKLDPAARDKEGQTALHRAAPFHRLPFLEALVQAGCPAKALDTKGRSALHAAVSEGHVNLDTVRWLKDQGLDLNQPDQEGWTPMQRFAHTAVVGKDEWPVLIHLGGDPLRPLPKGLSLVHEVNNPLLEDLLARGADVNARDVQGRTRLMRVAERLSPFEVEELLAFGADASLKDAAGRTAMDYLKLGQMKLDPEEARQSAAQSDPAKADPAQPNPAQARHDQFRKQDIEKIANLLKHPAQVEQRKPEKLEIPESEQEIPPPPPPPPPSRRSATPRSGKP